MKIGTLKRMEGGGPLLTGVAKVIDTAISACRGAIQAANEPYFTEERYMELFYGLHSLRELSHLDEMGVAGALCFLRDFNADQVLMHFRVFLFLSPAF